MSSIQPPSQEQGIVATSSIEDSVLNGRLSVDLQSEVPIYVQVKNQLKLLIESGAIHPGQQLPTVRDLALGLRINANTVSRIYADLAREGYAELRRGIGSFAAARAAADSQEQPGAGLLSETLRQLKALGYSRRQILELAAQLLSETT